MSWALALAAACRPAGGGAAPAPTPPPAGARAAARVRPPPSFERNEGQHDARVAFLLRAAGGDVFVTRTGATFAIAGSPASFDLRVVGGNPAAAPAGVTALPGRTNYYLGNDRTRWRTGVRSFRSVKVAGVYRGIDLVYRTDGARLAYDFVVASGADPGAIRLAFDGADALRTDARGDLIVSVGSHEVRQLRPRAYELASSGTRRELPAAFAVVPGKRELAFRVEGRDPERTLVIDPTVEYATYLGGGGNDVIRHVALDAAGNVFVVGDTQSPSFPGTAAGLSGYRDAFAAKLDPTGTTLLYATYVGGSSTEVAYCVAVDSAGNAWLAGETASNDVPGVPARASGRTDLDVLVVRLDAQGALSAARQLGGTENDGALAIDLLGGERAGVYLAGTTSSNDFPGAFGRAGSGRTDFDGLVVKLSEADLSTVYAVYLGGADSNEQVTGVVAGYHSNYGHAFVVGSTSSSTFPTARTGSQAGWDAFYIDVWDDTSRDVTRVGGSGNDHPQGIARDAAGYFYVVGTTTSTDLPGTSPRARSDPDAFVLKFSNLLDVGHRGNVVAAAYVGGVNDEDASAIAVRDGQVFIAGHTTSTDLPGAPARTTAGSDGFVARLPASLSGAPRSVYVGGSGIETVWGGFALAGPGVAWVAGSTQSTDLPASPGAVQGAHGGGGSDGWLARVSFVPVVARLTPAAGPVAGGTEVTLSGADLDGVTSVTFGGIDASALTVVNATTLQVRAPSHAAGAVDVVVTEATGASATLAGGFAYYPAGAAPPTVTSLSPTVGDAAGGTALTVTGTGLQAGAVLSLGGASATGVAVASATALTAVTAAHAPGAVDLVLSNPDGRTVTVPGAFVYHPGTAPAPVLTGISPGAGIAAGGFEVQLTGTGFQAGAAVTFGGVGAASVAVSTAATLTAVAPPGGKGTVDVVVTNPDGGAGTLPHGFTYLEESPGGCGCGNGGVGALELLAALGAFAAARRGRPRPRRVAGRFRRWSRLP